MSIRDEENYGLFKDGEMMDDDRSLGSYGLKANVMVNVLLIKQDTLRLKLKNDEQYTLTILIEDHVKLLSPM